MDNFALVQSSRFSTTDRWSCRITALAFPMRISNSLFCLPSLVNETPGYLNFSDCFSGTPSIWREHCFGCLDRHMVAVFVLLIFIPATEHYYYYYYYWHIYPPITRKRRSAIRACLGVASHLSTTLRWGRACIRKPVKSLLETILGRVEYDSTRSSANNRCCTVHSPILTPPQDSLFLTTGILSI